MAAPKPVVESNFNKDDNYPRPSEIRLSSVGSVLGGFGKHEVEIEAGRLVQFFQYFKGDLWAAFRLSELIKFYKFKGWNHNIALVGLIGAWCDSEDFGFNHSAVSTGTLLVGFLNSDGCLCVTEEFINRCNNCTSEV